MGRRTWVAPLLLALVMGTAGLAAGPFPFEAPELRGIESNVQAVELADISGDGELDLIVVTDAGSYGYAYCYAGQGDGGFSSEVDDSVRLYLHSTEFTLADYNNDRTLDLAALNSACST